MEKLRILLVTTGVMTNVLGVLKVHHDLKEEYEKQGHVVDVLDFSIIYPNGISVFNKIFGEFYTDKFWKYLQKHAHKYDVIDANNESIVYPKESFGFKGVLLVRSHGISPIYQKAENISSYKNALFAAYTKPKLKTRIGNFYRSLQKKPTLKHFFASVKYADLVHCLNIDEYNYYINYGVPKNKLVIIHNGLPDIFIENSNKSDTLKKTNSLCFIGSWTIRKGIKDFNTILINIKNQINVDKLYLLGGHYSEEYIRQDFDSPNQKNIDIISTFKSEQLRNYINACKVGLFPSYVEGFALAIIEQLACGIPVVAYRVPGSTDTLINLDETLLIEPGNIDAFAYKAIEIMQLDEKKYLELSEKCKLESKKYLLSKISEQFINAYYKKLTELKYSYTIN